MAVALFANGLARASSGDATADAVLGQAAFTSNEPNPPSGLPTAGNLAPTNAAHVAVALDGRLYVSDAYNNRVLSWPDAATFTNGQPADVVIGQPNFISGAPNNGGVSARSLYLPQGLAIDDEGNLWVADAFNSRVLKFLAPPTHDTQADLVIGQPDFTHNQQNLGNGDHGTHVAVADGLQFPGRVLVRGTDVYVADSGNSRVLHYSNPVSNRPVADVVFGQFGDFTARAKNNDGLGNNGCCASADNLYNPIGLAIDAGGSLYVADWNNNRMVRYDGPRSTDTTADAVFGQSGLATNTPNQGGLASGLWLPADVFIDSADRLYVIDSANNRVLVYRNPATSPSAAAWVLGQLGSFTTNSENHGLGMFETDADGLFGPTGVAVDAFLNVYVMDTNNNRMLRFDVPFPAPLLGDIDDDGDVDLIDFAPFSECMTGPFDGPPVDGCVVADLDRDNDVDLADFSILQITFGADSEP